MRERGTRPEPDRRPFRSITAARSDRSSLALFEVALSATLAGELVLRKERALSHDWILDYHQAQEELAMVIVSESAAALKGLLGQAGLTLVAREMVLRMVLAFIGHRGRMSCSQAAVSIASDN